MNGRPVQAPVFQRVISPSFSASDQGTMVSAGLGVTLRLTTVQLPLKVWLVAVNTPPEYPTAMVDGPQLEAGYRKVLAMV